VRFTRGQVAAGIETILTADRSRVLRTMPADLDATAGYVAVNRHPCGITPETAERAAWRAHEAHRFDVEPGFVLLAIAPPERPGGWSMLINAHDARDGAGTRLLAAWWLGPYEPRDPVAVFGKLVARFGVHLRDGRREALFHLHTTGATPPQPVTRPQDVDLYALPRTGTFREPLGWAWCFGIDSRRYRTFLDSFETLGRPLGGT
jgi:hypothetical protein